MDEDRDVTLPYESTVILGTTVEEPTVPDVTPDVAREILLSKMDMPVPAEYVGADALLIALYTAPEVTKSVDPEDTDVVTPLDAAAPRLDEQAAGTPEELMYTGVVADPVADSLSCFPATVVLSVVKVL